METNELIQKLEDAAPGGVLEARPFGRDGAELSLWVEMGAILKIAHALKSDPAFSFDYVENFAVMEMEAALVFTYWIRSSSTGLPLMIRGSVELPRGNKADDLIEVASVSSAWPSVVPQEMELGELFGIKFIGLDPRAHGLVSSRLAGTAVGFPLRKGFVFPTEINGQPHMRRLTPSAPAAGEVLP